MPPLYKPCLLHTEAEWSICVMKPGHYWFSCSTPSHYLNQCRLIVNRTHGSKFQWHLIEVLTFSWQKIHLKPSAQFYPFGLGLSEIENFAYREIDERSFSNSHPRAAQVITSYSTCGMTQHSWYHPDHIGNFDLHTVFTYSGFPGSLTKFSSATCQNIS